MCVHGCACICVYEGHLPQSKCGGQRAASGQRTILGASLHIFSSHKMLNSKSNKEKNIWNKVEEYWKKSFLKPLDLAVQPGSPRTCKDRDDSVEMWSISLQRTRTTETHGTGEPPCLLHWKHSRHRQWRADEGWEVGQLGKCLLCKPEKLGSDHQNQSESRHGRVHAWLQHCCLETGGSDRGETEVCRPVTPSQMKGTAKTRQACPLIFTCNLVPNATCHIHTYTQHRYPYHTHTHTDQTLSHTHTHI